MTATFHMAAADLWDKLNEGAEMAKHPSDYRGAGFCIRSCVDV